MERLLADAMRADRPVLIDPTEDELRAAADRLRQEGRLVCTRCRKGIHDEHFITRRIAFGPRLQAVVHLHPECDDGIVTRRAASPEGMAAGGENE